MGPSKSTATSSQHSSQDGLTATESCFKGFFRPLMQTRHRSAYRSRSACMLSHQHDFFRIACIFAPLRCAPRMPTCTCLQQNSFQLITTLAFPSGTTGTQHSSATPSRLINLSRRPSPAMRYFAVSSVFLAHRWMMGNSRLSLLCSWNHSLRKSAPTASSLSSFTSSTFSFRFLR